MLANQSAYTGSRLQIFMFNFCWLVLAFNKKKKIHNFLKLNVPIKGIKIYIMTTCNE